MDFDGPKKSPESVGSRWGNSYQDFKEFKRRIMALLPAGGGMKTILTRIMTVSAAALCLEAN